MKTEPDKCATLTVVGCGSAKLEGLHPARHLYTGNLFRAHLNLAQQLGHGKIYVVSAKYGLIELDEVVSSYDLRIQSLDSDQIGDWRRGVASAVEAITSKEALVCVLSGKPYASWTDTCHRRCWQPLAGLMLGERLSMISRLAAGS